MDRAGAVRRQSGRCQRSPDRYTRADQPGPVWRWLVELDRTEIFTHLRFWPEITVRVDNGGDVYTTERRVHKALAWAQKYSLVANSVKSEIIIEPSITIDR